MSRQACTLLTWLLVLVTSFTGCHPSQPFYLHENGDLSSYLDKATAIEYPDVETARLAEVEFAQMPINVADPDFDSFWDLTLEEVIAMTMQNSKVIRNLGAVQQFGFADGLLGRTAAAPTVYDAALSETNTLGGPRPVDRSSGSLFLQSPQTQATQQGVEDALSEFDAQFFSSVNYGNTDRPRNVQAGNPFNPILFQQHSASSLSAISKRTASGALYSFRNRTSYNENNIPIGIGRALPSEWQTEFEVEAQYPLLQGRGEQVNRIPILLARMNTDITLADFESSVRNLLMDVENTYWDLYLSYRAIETTRAGYDAAQLTWRIVYDKFIAGVENINARDEAQAREQYFFFRAQLEQAQNELLENENRLRWLMGLTNTDGRVIRPKDEPTVAEVAFDWVEVRTETLFRSPELRQQKWRIKQRELELIAARNQLLPRLNATATYRWVGVGDQLINSDRNGLNFPDAGSTAFDELTEGNFQEAAVGLEFTPPQFGARRPLAAIRHAQLQLARGQAQLEDMELQAIHLVGTAFRSTKARYALANSHFDRWTASQQEVQTAAAEFQGGRVALDLVLDAYRRRAQSQIDFYRALVDYNKAIAEVHFRKGSLLEFNNIALDEGPWPQKAYWDAVGRARERSASHPLHYGWTRPNVVSRGEVPDGTMPMVPGMQTEMYLPEAETIPAPEPTPADMDSEMELMDEPMMELEPPMDEPAPQPEASRQGPVTSRPQLPQLNAPTRSAGTGKTSRRVATIVRDEAVQPAVATEVATPIVGEAPVAKPAPASQPNAATTIPNPLRAGATSGLR